MATTPRPRRYHPSSPFQAPPEVEHHAYTVGERVSHDTWGIGRVLSLEADGALVAEFADTKRRITLPTNKMEAL